MVSSAGCYRSHEPFAEAEIPPAVDAGRPAVDAGRPELPPDAGVAPIDAGAPDVVLCDDDGGARDEFGSCAVDCAGIEICRAEGCCVLCLCPSTVWVEPGTFWRGSPEDEAGREDDEPRHRVSITRALVVDRTEVTQAEWRRLMGTDPSSHAGCDTCPVETIDRDEALQYANTRSAEEGLTECYVLEGCAGPESVGCPDDDRAWRRCDGTVCSVEFLGLDCDGWRLPTEAEWEYLARAGSEGPFPGGEDLTRATVYGWCSDAAGESHPVGLKPANAFGLLDIFGNVYEWTWDGYAPYPTSPDPLVDPIEPLGGNGAVIRGGAFLWGDSYCRAANRGARARESRENVVGFRLVRSQPLAARP